MGSGAVAALGDFQGQEALVRCGKDSVWVRIEMAANGAGKLRFNCTILSRQPLSIEETVELQDAVKELVKRTVETLDQETPAPEPMAARAVNRVAQPQVGALVPRPTWLLVPEQTSEACSFAVLANGVDSLANQGHAALMGAVRLFVSPSSPDADATYVLCQAITLPWDGLLARIATRLRIAGVVFAIATGNPLLLHTCVIGLARTLFARAVSLTVQEAIDAMFEHRESITDLTIQVVSANHQHSSQYETRESRVVPNADPTHARLGQQAELEVQARRLQARDANTSDHRDKTTHDKQPKHADSSGPSRLDAEAPRRGARTKDPREPRPHEERHRSSRPESPESASTGRHEPKRDRAGKAGTRSRQTPRPGAGAQEDAHGPHQESGIPHTMAPEPPSTSPARSVSPDATPTSTATPNQPKRPRHFRRVTYRPQSPPPIDPLTSVAHTTTPMRDDPIAPTTRTSSEITRADKSRYVAHKLSDALDTVIEPHAERQSERSSTNSVRIPTPIDPSALSRGPHAPKEQLDERDLPDVVGREDYPSRDYPTQGFGISGPW